MSHTTGNDTNRRGQTRVKICGITTAEDRDIAVDAGADAVGFISGVSVETPREITPETAATLAATTSPFVNTVLVTMPDDVTDAHDLIQRVRPDVVQLHGVSPDMVSYIAAVTNTAVIPAVTPADAPRYDSVADALLIDSLDESGAGGTGSTHEWDHTRDRVADCTSPVVLAGGLTPDNVSSAIDTVNPHGVDVASGVEREDGNKDAAAVRSFVEQARGAV